MATIEQDVAAIRQAVYGKDVREAIADGIENINSKVDTRVLSITASKIPDTDDDYVIAVTNAS